MDSDFIIKGEIFEWRGPAPYFFVKVPIKDGEIIKKQAKVLSYGWGVIPVHGSVGKTEFSTALFPKDRSYLIPIKDQLRKSENLDLGDRITIFLNLGKKRSN